MSGEGIGLSSSPFSNENCRSAIVALHVAAVAVEEISVFVQRSVWTVRRWIQRSTTNGDLSNLPRSGRPAIYSEETKLRMTAFYCQTKPLPGCGRWSLRWAAQHLAAKPSTLGASPGKSTLHRVLKDSQLKPHQSHYFLHITDPDFFPKMEHLVALYRTPPRHLFFFDECPGIQVIKRLTPDLQTDTMRQRLEEFEYIRNGTLDVFAFLHHADGKVTLECQADHATDTFIEVFRRQAERFTRNESLHYVMDNLASHRGYPFCRLVAELSEVHCPSEEELSTQVKRANWLRQDDKRIVIHFTPFHGSWLNLVEVWFGIMGRKVLTESFAEPDELKEALEAFALEWNILLAHPFRWTYDGAGLHEKAVKRFTAMLLSSPGQLETRTLTKLLMLMTNMLDGYFSEVSKESWHRLTASLSSQRECIANLISQEQGPRRKKKAQLAIAHLNAALSKRSLSPIKNRVA